jgi:LAGLIDADG DNA endonuclease family protein
MYPALLAPRGRETPASYDAVMDIGSSDNATGAVNQQERLESYIAGFVDGEGCFHVAIQRNPSTRSLWQLVPEFRISQDVSRVKVLDQARELLGCGLLRENHRHSDDHTFVMVVRRRKDLLERVIPFFERNPLLSCKQEEFVTFAEIVKAMARGEHLAPEGFGRLAVQALHMNGGGRYRRLHRGSESRILRDHMPGTPAVLRG